MAKDSDDDWLLSDEDTDTLHRSMDMEQRDRIKMESQFQTVSAHTNIRWVIAKDLNMAN